MNNIAIQGRILRITRLIQSRAEFTPHVAPKNPMKYRTLDQLDRMLAGRLVVSCQPVGNGPMDRDDIVVQLALAACVGGAGAVRVEGVARVAKVSAAFDGKISAPIIGIVKRDLADSPVRITPFVDDVRALVAAGADVIAVDGTTRARPATREALLAAIRGGGAIAMADCSSLEDAISAHVIGFEIIGTTLSGYTGGATNSETPIEPGYDLIGALKNAGVNRIMAEGRFNRPDQARRAIELGAWAVTVGTAITRTEVVTSWFAEAIKVRS
jgi:N-acylglucosamine-6-phosphate 2-epimerase